MEFLSIKIIFTILYATACMSFSDKGIIAYDCASNNINISSLSLVDVQPCTTEIANITTTPVKIQVLQTKRHFDLPTYQCKIIYKRDIFHCGWQSYSSAIQNSYKYILKELTSDECRRIHETGVVNVYNEISIPGLRRNMTNRGQVTLAGSIEGSSCQGTTYYDGSETFHNVVVRYEYEILLQTKNAIYDVTNNDITFSNGLTCKYDDFSCIDGLDGFFTWRKLPVSACNSMQFSVLYDGYANKTSSSDIRLSQARNMYTAISGDKMFSIQSKDTVDICNSKGYLTDHKNVFILEIGPYTTPIVATSPHTKDLDIFTYFNSKITLVEHHLQNQLTGMYRELVYDICQVERELMITQLSLAKKNPQEFISTIMKKPGYTAVHAGEVLYIIECTPVYVTLASTPTCYQEIPVRLHEDQMYLSPVTRILQRHGTEIDCSTVLMSKFKFGERWFNFDGRVIEVPGPKVLSPKIAKTWFYETLPNLIEGGIYDKESRQKMHDMIYEHDDKRAASGVMFRMISGKNVDQQNFKVESLLREDYIDGKIKAVWMKLVTFSAAFGQITSSMIGIWLLGKGIKYILDSIVHGKILYDIYGFSWRLLAAFWDSLALCLTHRSLYRRNSSTKETSEPKTFNNQEPPENKDPAPKAQLYPILTHQNEESQHVRVSYHNSHGQASRLDF